MMDLDYIKNYFKDLTFEEEGHKYKVSGKETLTSVSQIPKNFFEPFNVEYFSKKKSIETGVPQDQIKKEWKEYGLERARFGTKVHSFAEHYIYDRTLQPSNIQEEAVIRFFNNIPDYYRDFLPEFKMYHKELFFSGTADLPAYNSKTGLFDIFDYKTNKDIHKFYGKYLFEPFQDLKDNPFGHYTIAMSLYQILFEQTGYKVGKRYLVWLKPNGKVKIIFCEDVTDRLKLWLKNNYETIYSR